jgi:hypothetical protein
MDLVANKTVKHETFMDDLCYNNVYNLIKYFRETFYAEYWVHIIYQACANKAVFKTKKRLQVYNYKSHNFT